MLRRKLLLVLGPLVALLLVVALSAIVVLNAVLEDLSSASTARARGAASTASAEAAITSIEAALVEMRLDRPRHHDALIDAVEALERDVDALCLLPAVTEAAAPEYERLRDVLIPAFTDHVGALATAAEPAQAALEADRTLGAAVAARESLATIGGLLRAHADREETRVTTRFRWVVMGLGLTFLVVINASILALLRAASMILRPVEKLVEASRCLAREEFGHRVEIAQHDEFGELAHAYNRLAEQLRLNEQRKIETLQQVARTLNHELNNAIAIIEMQLALVERAADGDRQQEGRLREIHRTLDRMSGTVDALKRVRRIVLTDYVEGVKMLDLERSVEDAAPETARDEGKEAPPLIETRTR